MLSSHRPLIPDGGRTNYRISNADHQKRPQTSVPLQEPADASAYPKTRKTARASRASATPPPQNHLRVNPVQVAPTWNRVHTALMSGAAAAAENPTPGGAPCRARSPARTTHTHPLHHKDAERLRRHKSRRRCLQARRSMRPPSVRYRLPSTSCTPPCLPLFLVREATDPP